MMTRFIAHDRGNQISSLDYEFFNSLFLNSALTSLIAVTRVPRYLSWLGLLKLAPQLSKRVCPYLAFVTTISSVL